MAGLTPPRPLTAEDDRNSFDCGRETLNQWLQRHAWRNQEAGVSRTSVVCDPDTGAIVGYVSLSAAQIERAWLPKAQQRNRPDPISAVLLSQFAVDRRYQGWGLCAITNVLRAHHRCAVFQRDRVLLRADPSAR